MGFIFLSGVVLGWIASILYYELTQKPEKQSDRSTVPDWANAPDWANWWAQDANGAYAYYEKKPVGKNSTAWSADGTKWAFDDSCAPSWEDSLQQRPETITK